MGWVPIVTSFLSSAAPIASAVFGAASAIGSANAKNKAASAQAASNAAAMSAATEEARLTREDANTRAQAERDSAAKVRSQQLAMYLKSGVTLDGSPMLVMNDTTAKGDQNAKNIIDNAESSANSLLLRGQASQQVVQRADLFGTTGEVLGSAAKAATAYKTAYGS